MTHDLLIDDTGPEVPEEGVFSHCDHWCFRCPLTRRCELFLADVGPSPYASDHDQRNGAFWTAFDQRLHQATALLRRERTRLAARLAQLPLPQPAGPEEHLPYALFSGSEAFQEVLRMPLPTTARTYDREADHWLARHADALLRAADRLDAAAISGPARPPRTRRAPARDTISRSAPDAARARRESAPPAAAPDPAPDARRDSAPPAAAPNPAPDARLDAPESAAADRPRSPTSAVPRSAGRSRTRFRAVRARPPAPPNLLREAIEVIRWYRHTIDMNLTRAVARTHTSGGPFPGDAPSRTPGHASLAPAKVALVALDRSLVGWSLVYEQLPEHALSILQLVSLLDELREHTELTFPGARAFRRPGFDDPPRPPSGRLLALAP